tara:strand:+ start:672 stop:1037 length:366 start_codon:yes stop_codon:yes gene_type:complete
MNKLKKICQYFIFAVVAVFLSFLIWVSEVRSEDYVEARLIKMLCMEKKLFKKTIAKNQELFFIGTMPTTSSVVEIYRAKDLSWSVLIRSPFDSALCVLATGNQLIDVDWFAEKNLLPEGER